MSNTIYKVGSRAFFSNYEDFRSKDYDTLKFVEGNRGFNYVRQIKFADQCIFEWVKRPKQEMIDYALNNGAPMQVGKFLIKDIAEELNFTVEDLVQLKPLIDNLDTEHKYEEVIYNSIVNTGSWDIPQEVLDEAYAMYKEDRKKSDII